MRNCGAALGIVRAPVLCERVMLGVHDFVWMWGDGAMRHVLFGKHARHSDELV